MTDTNSAIELVVKEEFGGHKIGEVITDAEEIGKILDGPHEAFVIKRPKA